MHRELAIGRVSGIVCIPVEVLEALTLLELGMERKSIDLE